MVSNDELIPTASTAMRGVIRFVEKPWWSHLQISPKSLRLLMFAKYSCGRHYRIFKQSVQLERGNPFKCQWESTRSSHFVRICTRALPVQNLCAMIVWVGESCPSWDTRADLIKNGKVVFHVKLIFRVPFLVRGTSFPSVCCMRLLLVQVKWTVWTLQKSRIYIHHTNEVNTRFIKTRLWLAMM